MTDPDKYSWIDDKGQNISGAHFTRGKLGKAKWCRTVLNMNQLLSQQFSAVIRQRITKYENAHRKITPERGDVNNYPN